MLKSLEGEIQITKCEFEFGSDFKGSVIYSFSQMEVSKSPRYLCKGNLDRGRSRNLDRGRSRNLDRGRSRPHSPNILGLETPYDSKLDSTDSISQFSSKMLNLAISHDLYY